MNRNPNLSNMNSLPAKQIFFILFSILSLSKPSLQTFNFAPRPNARLLQAYNVFQSWKLSITDDPNNITANWDGPDVCNYTGVFCAPAPGDPFTLTVAGVDLNHGNIAGALPANIGLLPDISLLHLNSNRFTGTLPESFRNLRLLFELDISNNDFSGQFPSIFLSLPALKYLDIRFNKFHGDIPSRLFDMNLDAIFINNNQFCSSLPENIGNSTASVLVFANNNLTGCLPPSLAKMKNTLQEIIITDSGLSGCLPPEIGQLRQLTVFDVSGNQLAGTLPETMAGMRNLEQLNVAHNKFSGDIPAGICSLPNLQNFTYSYNFICREPPACRRLQSKDDQRNCIPDRPVQRSQEECAAFNARPVDCNLSGCSSRPAPSSPSMTGFHSFRKFP